MRRENRLMSQTIFIMLTTNDESKKREGILLLLYSPMLVHSCIQSQSRSRRVKLPFISCFSSTTKKKKIYIFLALGAFHKKQTRNVHQQHQKLFNIKMNVYEEKRVNSERISEREKESIT
jgi:hypothetical protein